MSEQKESVSMKKDFASSLETAKKLLKYIRHHFVLLILSAVLACITVILQLIVPILFGDAIDQIIGKGQVNFEAIRMILAAIVFIILIASLTNFLMNLINNRITYEVVKEIRAKAIRRLQVLPLKYLDEHSIGDIVSRFIADTDQLSEGLLLGFSVLFTGGVQILMTLIFMLSKSVLVTLLVIVFTPVSFIVAKFIASHTYTMFQKQTEIRGRETALINEMIGNEKTVQAFGYEYKASKRFYQVNQELKEASEKAVFYSSLTNPSTRFVNGIIYAAVAVSGSFLILTNALSVGSLSALLTYANQYMKPFNDISSVISEMQNAFACAARVFAFIEEEAEIPDAELELKDVQGAVSLKHVSFSYEEDQKLIQDLNIETRPGMRIALVGPTGCGKTTLINLLMRFYDVQEGDIKIDVQSIYDISRKSLRENYGMVLQDTWIKKDTVRNNIMFGKKDATEQEIINACKAAHSWNFIKRLPRKLNTVIDEDSLSEGEKQLLCITRVMLALPPMLILDEATSSIDTRTELEIQQAFDTLMQGRTSFVVAHRLSTVRNADLILVMKDGKIIERGNHKQLMNENGFYTDLYNSQFEQVL